VRVSMARSSRTRTSPRSTMRLVSSLWLTPDLVCLHCGFKCRELRTNCGQVPTAPSSSSAPSRPPGWTTSTSSSAKSSRALTSFRPSRGSAPKADPPSSPSSLPTAASCRSTGCTVFRQLRLWRPTARRWAYDVHDSRPTTQLSRNTVGIVGLSQY
jgi:hypothetical protein